MEGFKMDMNELLVPGGFVTVAGGIVAKVVSKLYEDMKAEMNKNRDEHQKREEKLMQYLEQKNVTDKIVAEALQDMSERLQSMSCRIDNLEGGAK